MCCSEVMWPPGCICYFLYLSVKFLHSLLSTVKPSKPRCYAEGPTQEGKDIVLKCLSSEGTNPLQYSWEKISDGMLLPASAVLGNGPFNKHFQIKKKKKEKNNFFWFHLKILFQFTTSIFSLVCFFILATDPVGGNINVRNASGSASGTYRCTAKNRVGSEECTLHLNVTPREYWLTKYLCCNSVLHINLLPCCLITF